MDNTPLAETLMSSITKEDIKYIQSLAPDDGISPEVLQELKDGDHDAYRTVYARWRKPIFNLLNRLLGSEAEADDVTQDVFTNLWVIRERIDIHKNIKSYLYLMARQSAIKHFEKQKVRKSYTEGTLFEDVDYSTSYDIVVEKELTLLKSLILERMPAQRRRIYEMSYSEGLSNEQIAKQLRITKATVSNQLSIARKDIRDILAMILITFLLP